MSLNFNIQKKIFRANTIIILTILFLKVFLTILFLKVFQKLYYKIELNKIDY